MKRTPQWSTNVQTSSVGDLTRTAHQTTPIWKWTLQRLILKTQPNFTGDGDLILIENLFNSMYGRLDYFLWFDPEGADIVDPTQQINILGTYYWPVAFTQDTADYDRFAYQLWECSQLEFEQVKLADDIFQQVQRPHGAVITATMTTITSHIPGTSEAGFAWVAIGPTPTNFGGDPAPGWPTFFRDATSWTSRTDTGSISILIPLTAEVDFSISNSILNLDTVADEFRIFDVSMSVHYQDGTITTVRPTVATVTTDPQGAVTNPGNAIDGNPATYASITRTAFGPGSTGTPILRLSNFA